MNKLERALLAGAQRAQNTYRRMSGGWWLWHAPESLLMHEVARSISRTGNEVFTEASPAKIAREFSEPLRGRPSKDQRKRFDIVVWQRTINRTRAIVEIKRTTMLQPVSLDAAKIKKYLNLQSTSGVGYVLVYSEAKGLNRRVSLAKRSFNAAEKLGKEGWRLIDVRVTAPRTDEWAWSIYLLRYDPPS